MTKEEKIEEINAKVDAARLEAHMTTAPIMLEQELEKVITDWEKRHPEFSVRGCTYFPKMRYFQVTLSETGEKPLYLKMKEDSKRGQELSSLTTGIQKGVTALGGFRIMDEVEERVKRLSPMADGMINVIKGDA